MAQTTKRLDATLVVTLGYAALTPAQANRLLAALYETAEVIIGARIANGMRPAQLDRFEEFIDANDDAGALEWLGRNFPTYKNVVSEVFDSLEAELKMASTRVAGTETPAEDE